MTEAARVIWFTGLSGAGKTTLAEKLAAHIKNSGGKCELLDGDTVRNIFPQTGFSKKERDEHIKRMGFLASMLERNGIRSWRNLSGGRAAGGGDAGLRAGEQRRR